MLDALARVAVAAACSLAAYDAYLSAARKLESKFMYLSALFAAAAAAALVGSGAEAPSSPFASAVLLAFSATLAASLIRGVGGAGPSVRASTAMVGLGYLLFALVSSAFPGVPPVHFARVEWYTIVHPVLVVLAVPAAAVYAAAVIAGGDRPLASLAAWTVATAALATGMYWAYNEPGTFLMYLFDPLTALLTALWLSLSSSVLLRRGAALPAGVAAAAAIAEGVVARSGLSLLHAVSRDPALSAAALIPGLALVAVALTREGGAALASSASSLITRVREGEPRAASAALLLAAALVLLLPTVALATGAFPGIPPHAVYSSRSTFIAVHTLAALAMVAIWPLFIGKGRSPALAVVAVAAAFVLWNVTAYPIETILLSTISALTLAIALFSLVRGRGTLAAVAAPLSLAAAIAPVAVAALSGHGSGTACCVPSEVDIRPLGETFAVPPNSFAAAHASMIYSLLTNDTYLEEFVNGTDPGFADFVNASVAEVRRLAAALGLELDPALEMLPAELPRGLAVTLRPAVEGAPDIDVVFDFEAFFVGGNPLSMPSLTLARGLDDEVFEVRPSRGILALFDALVINYTRYAVESARTLKPAVFIALTYGRALGGNAIASLQVLPALLQEEPPPIEGEVSVCYTRVPLARVMWVGALALVATQVGALAKEARLA